MLLLLLATRVDSYTWTEPTTDVEYRLRGVWMTLGWFISIGAALFTFIFLMLLGWAKAGVIALISYLNKSVN